MQSFLEAWCVKETLEGLISEVHNCEECKELKSKIALLASHLNPVKKGISEVCSKNVTLLYRPVPNVLAIIPFVRN